MTSQKRIFANASQLSHPRQLVCEMWADLMQARYLAKTLAVRDISAKYRQTFLGIAWVFLPPLVTTLAFVILQRQQILSSGVENASYPVFAMVGVVFWQLFSESVMAPLQMVQSSKSLLAKILFPREALLLAAMYQVLFNFAVKLLLMTIAMFILGVPPAGTVIFVPIAAMGLLMLGFLIGIILVPIGILYQDVLFSLGVLLMLLMFLTPVGFAQPEAGWIAEITRWNPVAPLLQCARDWMLAGSSESVYGLVWVLAGTVVFMGAGWVLYRLSFPIAVERMGN